MDILPEPRMYAGEDVVVEVYASNSETDEPEYRGPAIEDLEPAVYMITRFKPTTSTVEAILGDQTLYRLNVYDSSKGTYPLKLHLAELSARAAISKVLQTENT